MNVFTDKINKIQIQNIEVFLFRCISEFLGVGFTISVVVVEEQIAHTCLLLGAVPLAWQQPAAAQARPHSPGTVAPAKMALFPSLLS